MARSQLQVDLEMLRRIAAGESAALGELYDRYGSLSYALALRIVGNAGDAEEIVQDVFLHVWRQSERYDPARATLTGWILMLTRSRAIDRLRARQARPPLAPHDLDWSQAAADNQEVTAITQEAATRVKAALEALPQAMRQAIELAYYDGLTHSEIAERLQEPLGTVKSRLRAALLRLRETLKGRTNI
ncbi:MAG TPA: sigma-70 family RNA polymerase sigma factor [Vicinamibacterales bacterium]|nr:sigma-70 family RNA polymerase sigma factor [Vicinamibacterales bacterium]